MTERKKEILFGIAFFAIIAVVALAGVLLFPDSPYSDVDYYELTQSQFIELVEFLTVRAARFRALFYTALAVVAALVGIYIFKRSADVQHESFLKDEIKQKDRRIEALEYRLHYYQQEAEQK